MSEPTKKHCEYCGGDLLHWADIAACMRAFIPNAPIGYRPVFIQAATEIEQLRTQVEALATDAKRFRWMSENCYCPQVFLKGVLERLVDTQMAQYNL